MILAPFRKLSAAAKPSLIGNDKLSLGIAFAFGGMVCKWTPMNSVR